MGQLFALAAGHREGVAGSASALIQSAKMRSYIYYESVATAPPYGAKPRGVPAKTSSFAAQNEPKILVVSLIVTP